LPGPVPAAPCGGGGGGGGGGGDRVEMSREAGGQGQATAKELQGGWRAGGNSRGDSPQ